jgi:uncharacterized membrane protein
MQGTKAFLTEMFDCPESYTRTTKQGSICITSPCLGITSATTADWFVSSVRAGDIEGGFLGRFIYVYSKKKVRDDAFPPKLDIAKRATLYSQLQEHYNAYKNLDCEMGLSAEAKALYSKWYHSFVEKFNNTSAQYRLLLARLNIYCLKIAIVLETNRNYQNLIISEKSVAEAIAIANYLFKTVVELCDVELSLNQYDAAEKKILKMLSESGELTRTDFLKKSHLSSQYFSQIVATLVEKDLITTFKKTTEGADKPTLVYQIKK